MSAKKGGSMMEEWRHVVGGEGKYWISSLGRLRGPRGITAGSKDKDGYLRTSLSLSHRCRPVRIHRLVAEAFLDGDMSLPVNHKDSDVTNNAADNLELITQRENVHHSMKCGRRNFKGEGHPSNRLTKEQVLLIREMREHSKQFKRNSQPFPISWLAKCFKVDTSTIHYIEKRRLWGHI
jgi:hypothetical protein